MIYIIFLSIYLSIFISIYLSINQTIYLSRAADLVDVLQEPVWGVLPPAVAGGLPLLRPLLYPGA